MNNKQSWFSNGIVKQQHGDAAVNFVVVIAAAILTFLLWQYFQSTSREDTQQNDRQATIEETTDKSSESTTDDLLNRQQETLRAPNPDQRLGQSEVMPESTDDRNALNNQNIPPLDNSDTFVRNSLENLSETTTWKTWISTAQPVRKFTQFMDNVARGKVPHKYFRFMAPSGTFKVRTVSDDVYVLDPVSYHRFDAVAKCIDSLDAAMVVSAYEKLESLVNAAWSELKSDQVSGKNHVFDQVLLSAIKKIRSAPAITDEIRLIRPSVMYKYADPKLEHLNAVSKQMIRMGPVNTRIIQKKLDEIEALFDARHNRNSSSLQNQQAE